MATPSAPRSGTIDVTPSALYGVSAGVAGQQDPLDKGIKSFLAELARYPDGGGNGSAMKDFTAAYAQVANRFLDVWAKAVVSVGGAAVGFTTTADNYAAADAATHPSPSAHPASRPLPVVIDKPPAYGPVTDFTWGDLDPAQSITQEVLEGLEAAVLAVLRPLLEHECRWGKAATILPLPHHLRLYSTSQAWRMPQSTLGMVDGTLTALIGGITDQTDQDWYNAMRTFCSTLWGTSAWGRNREGYDWSNDDARKRGTSHPVFAVLFDTCDAMADAVYAVAKAAEDVRDDLHRIYRRAVVGSLRQLDPRELDVTDPKSLVKGLWHAGKGLVTDLSVGIVLDIDEGALNDAVSAYDNRIHRQVGEIKALLPALDEAYTSAPSFSAETARAEAFGARALTDFKGDPLYTVPGDDESRHRFPVDLANQEGLAGSHVIDKHVGKTDEQLEQRLRDQGKLYPDGVVRPVAVSTFKSLDDAQRFTQAVLDDPGNQKKIEKWLMSNKPNKGNRTVGLDFKQPTGRTWARGDSQPHDSDMVSVTLRSRPGGHPPYVVLTSTPSDKPPPA
ncbi:RNase A-like domain-containing protein [Streptomyces sp. NRRL S-340]|uniref:RNase A-like domain-containing protein n=1 Tax=Streptomyces sp. NRRL S-340 TaxID=1463901 RepID=UPI00068CEE68|nr:RNase A-like domain-containing protein [Streptomyces sp. NRRL S-340]